MITHRYTHKKLTILSTNWPLQAKTGSSTRSEQMKTAIKDTLEERIGRRLFSRIMEMCEVVQVEGPDYRTDIDKASRDFRQKKTESND